MYNLYVNSSIHLKEVLTRDLVHFVMDSNKIMSIFFSVRNPILEAILLALITKENYSKLCDPLPVAGACIYLYHYPYCITDPYDKCSCFPLYRAPVLFEVNNNISIDFKGWRIRALIISLFISVCLLLNNCWIPSFCYFIHLYFCQGCWLPKITVIIISHICIMSFIIKIW